MARNTDGLVLLVGSGLQAYRQYLMEGAARRYRLWLLDEQEPTWQKSLTAGASVVGCLDDVRMIPDQQGLVDAALGVAGRYPVLGAFTYDELLVEPTARITQRLSLRGLSPESAARCRDKHQARRALAEAGLTQPAFDLASDLGQAGRIAAAIGYPVVLKPLGMAASVGVVRADDEAGLAGAFGIAERASRFGPAAHEGAVLVEELIEGPEISVDGAVTAGRYHPFCLARKHAGMAPYFEELGHSVDSADPLLRDRALHEVLAAGHRALGVTDGVTHSEVKFGRRGPVIIEVNARLGGDLIPRLGMLATGVDPGQVAADVAVGAAPCLEASRQGCVAIRFLYPPQDCRVLEVCLPEPDAVPGLVATHAIARAGDILRLPPRAHIARFAYVICAADDPGGCADRLEAAAKLTTIRYQALDASELSDGRPW